jgi:5-hydroxyisourate hydrolase
MSLSGLTTHVLDLAHGRPAAGMALRLYRDGQQLRAAVTNADGRCDAPLLAELGVGKYRLEFEVAAYFRDQGVALAEPAFLDVVGLEFGISDPTLHHHVPLLVSPYGYSTYRGS